MTVIRKTILLGLLILLAAISVGGGTLLAWRAVLQTAESRIDILSTPVARRALRAAVQAPAPLPPAVPRARGPVPAPPAPAAPPTSAGTVQLGEGVEIRRIGRPVTRIGRDYRLPAGDAVRGVVVISGGAIIEGEVDGDMVVVIGRAELASTAVIRGSLTVVGGSLVVRPGADVRQELVVVGSAFDAPADFNAGGEHVIIGDSLIGDRVDSVVPWITSGLIWGRPLVLSIGWLWGVVALFLIVYLAIALVFARPVRASTETLVKRPLGAFLTGILVLLLLGPVVFILAVSVVGIIVIPFLLCALFLAWLVGKVSVLRWIGASVMAEDDPENKLESVRSFIIGFVIVTLIYLVPVLGIMTWGTIGVWGLGTASLTLIGALRRENPNGSKRRPVSPAGPPVPPGPSPAPQYQPAMYVGTPVAHAAEPLQTAPAAGGEWASGPSTPPSVPASDAPPQAPYVPPSTASATYASTGGAYAPSGSSAELLAMPHAPFLQRAAAFGLDVVLVLFSLGFLAPKWFMRDGPEPFFFVLFVYHVAFWANKGSTVGGLICNLRVIRTDGTSLRLADAILRGLAGIFSLVVAGLGALWILKDPERQAWHDRIAGTFVISVPRSYPIR